MPISFERNSGVTPVAALRPLHPDSVPLTLIFAMTSALLGFLLQTSRLRLEIFHFGIPLRGRSLRFVAQSSCCKSISADIPRVGVWSVEPRICKNSNSTLGFKLE